jgi:hypothetical protein
MRGADDRLRASAHPDPGPERAEFDRRKHHLVLQRRAQSALPAHRLLLQQRREQVELLLEQFFILPEVEAE